MLHNVQSYDKIFLVASSNKVIHTYAGVAELADAQDLKSCGR